MGLLLHSHRSLHEIRSRMAGATRLLKRSIQANFNQIAFTFLRVFLAGAAASAKRGAKKFKMKIFFLAPGLAIVSTVAGVDQTSLAVDSGT